MLPDHYALLQARPNANAEELRHCLERRVEEIRSGREDARRRLDALLESYAVLSDPQRRRAYDRQRLLGNARGRPAERPDSRKPSATASPLPRRARSWPARRFSAHSLRALAFTFLALAAWAGAVWMIETAFLADRPAPLLWLVAAASAPAFYGALYPQTRYFALEGDRLLVKSHWAFGHDCLPLADLEGFGWEDAGPFLRKVRFETAGETMHFYTWAEEGALARLAKALLERMPESLEADER